MSQTQGKERIMRKRNIFSLLGGASFAGPARASGSRPNASDAWKDIDTPEKRETYAKGLLKELCSDLGPHPSGTPEYDRAAAIIEREMKRSLPNVEQVRFDMEGWRPAGKPLFRVGDAEVEICPYYGTPGTPAKGVTGVIRKSGGGYSLVDPKTGERLALFAVSPYGRAITHPDFRRTSPVITRLGVGRQDVPMLDNAALSKTPSALQVDVEFIPLVTSSSVAGTLPGKSTDEILFISHLDTVYTAPGGNDNTASTIVMVLLAHAAAARIKPELTMTFIAAGAEEHGFLGAWKCGRKREKDGAMGNIKYVINFDSLTYGPNLYIYSTDADMRDMIRSIHVDLKIGTDPQYFEESGFTMDSLPFKPSGAKAMYVNSRGYDERTLPVYHRLEDTAESVPLDCVEIGFKVFEEFIRRVGVK